MTPTSRASSPHLQPQTLARAARELGLSSMALYAGYQIALRGGWLRLRTPIYQWDDRPLESWLRPGVPQDPAAYVVYCNSRENRPRFFFEPEADLSAPLSEILGDRRSLLLQEVEGILQGRFRLFGGPVLDLGFPPRWEAFAPLAGGEHARPVDLSRHWTQYHPDSFEADVKLLWEPSRFSWVFPLVRAYRLTGDTRYADGCLELIESWRASNRPNAGPHWFSAQEAALRILALAFARHGLEPFLQSAPHRAALLTQLVAVHADRVPATLLYSRSLRNNHLVVEAVGLFTAGVLFPELRGAQRWLRLGRRWLAASLDQQVSDDGSHLQHSVNYHRMVLQAGLWAARLADMNDHPLPQSATRALGRMEAFERGLIDPETGGVPNFGPNDGAELLPLSVCIFGDYRPTLQLASTMLGRHARPPGPWDEARLWFGLPSPSETPPRPDAGAKRGTSAVLSHQADSFPQGGLYWIHGRAAKAMLRCARFSARPGHSDQLHVDLWHRGRCVVRDAGSYLYNAGPPWDNALALAAVHNAPVVDGQEPMRRAGRFLWLEWAQGRWIGRWRSQQGRLDAVSAEHKGYRRLGVVLRRTVVRAGDELWMIVDELHGRGPHTARVSWLLDDQPAPHLSQDQHQLTLPDDDLTILVDGPDVRLGLYRAGAHIAGATLPDAPPTWGWFSPTYAVREPALSLACELRADPPLRWASWFCFGEARPSDVSIDWRVPGEGPTPFLRVDFDGDHLTAEAASAVSGENTA